jgi:hypothetical protein
LKQQREKKQQWLQKGHGEVQFLTNEKEFFAAMKGEDKMVCHFFRDNWPCKIIDKHIATLCKQHLECKFAKVGFPLQPTKINLVHKAILPLAVFLLDRPHSCANMRIKACAA